jgi:DNA-binding transcriptional regulator YhcF (GntR family)
MTENRIAELFSINPSSSVPFRTQLERKLELFIKSSAPGTPIPPERILAKCLGISRVTVRNAITPFLTAGSIIRHNRNGTVVARKQEEPDLKVNELAIGLPWQLQPVTTLKFLCYETLPAQRIFWESIIEEFNTFHTNCQVEPVWLDQLLKGSAMRNFIIQNGIDLMLHSPMYELPLESLAAELPQDIREAATDSSYIFNKIRHFFIINTAMVHSRKFIFFQQILITQS